MSRPWFAVALCVAACSVDLAPLEADAGRSHATGGTPSGGTAGTSAFGGTSGGGTGGSAGLPPLDAGPDTSTGDPCQDCEATSCTDFYNACAGSPDCSNLSSCMYSCADPHCQVDCYNSFANGYGLYYALASCTFQVCSPQCGTSQQCYDCESANCSAPMNACAKDVNCIAYWYCVGVCSDAASCTYCDDVFGQAVAAEYDDYVNCVNSLCSSSCS